MLAPGPAGGPPGPQGELGLKGAQGTIGIGTQCPIGNGAQGQLTDTLYFTAGIPGSGSVEDHGLYGSLAATPEPQSALLLGMSGITMIAISFVLRIISHSQIKKSLRDFLFVKLLLMASTATTDTLD